MTTGRQLENLIEGDWLVLRSPGGTGPIELVGIEPDDQGACRLVREKSIDTGLDTVVIVQVMERLVLNI